MPRKPTPSILEEALSMQNSEEAPPVADLGEIAAPPPPKKRSARPKAAAAPPAAEAETTTPEALVETTQEALEAIAEPVQEKVEAVVEAIAEPIQEEVAGVVETVVEPVQEKLEEALEAVEQIAEQTPDELESAQCRPAFRLARTLVLASLGMLSYALEIVHKLVERGELTEQEGMKLVGELSKNAQSRLPVDMPARFLERVPFRRKKKAAEAVEDEAEIPEELMTVPEAAMEAEVEPAEAPGNEEGAEEEPEKEKRSNVQTNTNILTLHFLSIGSPVIVEPDKPKKPKEKK